MAERIAISGSAGTGKSTLARRLAAELGVPYIGEGMREYLESTGVDLHTLGWDGVRALVQRLWEERKEAEARCAAGFVADRSSYDFAAFWLYYRFAQPDPETQILLAEATEAGRYDAVFVLPWGTIPLEADGVRSTDPYVQLHTQMLIEGFVRRHAARVVDVRAAGLDERVAAVLAALGRAR